MGIIYTPESQEQANLGLIGGVVLKIYIVKNNEEKGVFLQRLQELAVHFSKQLHLLDYSKASLYDLMGKPRVIKEDGREVYVLDKPSWMGEDPLWLAATNIAGEIDDIHDARVKFSKLILLLPAAIKERETGGIGLSKGSIIRAVVTQDDVPKLKPLINCLGESVRFRVASEVVERNDEGLWQKAEKS